MGLIIVIINILFSLAYLILVLRALIPWFSPSRDNLLYRLTDPLCVPIQQGLPPEKIGMDVSPAVAIILLWLVQRLVLFLLGGLA